MHYLRFNYVNHHGERHQYMMMPEPALSYGTCGSDGPFGWLLSGHVMSRDGVLRPGRRTFLLHEMKDLELVGGNEVPQ
jgi:hypothetical protein